MLKFIFKFFPKGNYLNMVVSIFVFAIISYVLTFIFINKSKKITKLKYKDFPHLKMTKSGIVFFSKCEHRLKLSNLKTLQIGNILYIKSDKYLLIISNINNVKIFNGFLYFKALGTVKILFDCKNIYKYFALNITSKQFNLEGLKQQAILDIMNNNFDINFSKIAKKFIKIIENVLNINIFEEKIVIKQNKFKLSFVVTYKLNNKIKRIIVNETL